jgi:hypothetical protein
VLVQVVSASLLAWFLVGAITVGIVAFTDRRAGSAFGIAAFLVMVIVLLGGAATAAFAERAPSGRALDWLLGPEVTRSGPGEDEPEALATGLTPLGVALVVTVEIAAVLVLSNVR